MTSSPGAVLGWKSRHDAERAVAQARAEGRRRHRRLAFLTFGALVALAAMTALAIFAFSQRSEARDQARWPGAASSSRAPSPCWTAIPSSGSPSPSRRPEPSRRCGPRTLCDRRSTRRASVP